MRDLYWLTDEQMSVRSLFFRRAMVSLGLMTTVC